METDTTETGADRLGNAIIALENRVQALACDLARLHRRIRAGDLQALAGARQRSDDIRHWLHLALEMEKRLETNATDGRRRGTPEPIDLSSARDQIGCRLDRLRRARCPGSFS